MPSTNVDILYSSTISIVSQTIFTNVLTHKTASLIIYTWNPTLSFHKLCNTLWHKQEEQYIPIGVIQKVCLLKTSSFWPPYPLLFVPVCFTCTPLPAPPPLNSRLL